MVNGCERKLASTPLFSDIGPMLKQKSTLLRVSTLGAGLHDITGEVSAWVSSAEIQSGLLTVFCRHSSASLLIQENAAPAARRDLEAFFQRIAPESPTAYTHNDEGPDDMPAHLRTALTQTSLSIPVAEGRMLLGTWQGIYLFEHRRDPHQRSLALHLIGE
jgi:secondary thiamine-phosphate synthase enzyme